MKIYFVCHKLYYIFFVMFGQDEDTIMQMQYIYTGFMKLTKEN